jgi:hypothetical protein
MDSMDNFRERFEALEQRTVQLHQHTRTVERRLRWWRGIACGVIVLALLGIPLQSGKAQYEDKDLAQRLAALEYKLEYISGGPNEVVITGANLRIVNGLGTTYTTNGLGNLIVGYNEERGDSSDNRTGSHNVVVGIRHNFSGYGGLAVGDLHDISGAFAAVSGGVENTASGPGSSVSGGYRNMAHGFASSVSGGEMNTARGARAVVSGGIHNTAEGNWPSVSGGTDITVDTENGWAAGSFGGTISGSFRSP